MLAAAVGVEDHARLGIRCRDRVGRGAGDQLGAQVIGHGMADDPPRCDVDDGGQVEPAFAARSDLSARLSAAVTCAAVSLAAGCLTLLGQAIARAQGCGKAFADDESLIGACPFQ